MTGSRAGVVIRIGVPPILAGKVSHRHRRKVRLMQRRPSALLERIDSIAGELVFEHEDTLALWRERLSGRPDVAAGRVETLAG